MVHIHLPITGAFDSKILELADRFEEAAPGEKFRLSIYDTGTVHIDAVLGFYDVVQSRPKGLEVHIHSHVSLQGSELLIWLAGDTRTLRKEAWVHFREYPRDWLERSSVQQFTDAIEGRCLAEGKTAFQENYLTVERLVKKQFPVHLWNRRVWGAELAEWNIVKPGKSREEPATSPEPAAKRSARKPSGKQKTARQMGLFKLES